MPTESTRHRRKHLVESTVEWVLFNSRWLLAPLYLGLVGTLLLILVKFGQTFVEVAAHIPHEDLRSGTVAILELLDIVLLGNLVVLVIFVGYHNFVSRLETGGHEDRPTWLGRLGFSGLKLRLIASIIAISMIELLRDFISPSANGYRDEGWRIGLHATFVVSGLIFALTDYFAARAPEE